jgi:hypothetical protein
LGESSRLETNHEVMETLIAAARSFPETRLELTPLPDPSAELALVASEAKSVPKSSLNILWGDSYQLTQFILKWNLRPTLAGFTSLFVNELARRNGLRAYGVRLAIRRRTKINQIHSGNVQSLIPRQLAAPKIAPAQPTDIEPKLQLETHDETPSVAKVPAA